MHYLNREQALAGEREVDAAAWQAVDDAEDTHGFPVVRRGVAAFQCCGSSRACVGSWCYEVGGGGSCGICRSDRLQISWPKMNGQICGPSNGCALPSDFPSHSCRAVMPVKNPCSGREVRVRVPD